jgi:type I restriction enzyme M protein
MSLSLLLARAPNPVSRSGILRLRDLAERYAEPLPKLTTDVETLSARVEACFKKMGASWA